MTQAKPAAARTTPWWVVLVVFVVIPVSLAFLISRQAAARQIRRKAIASSHGWAIENRNEGQRAFILRGFHREVEFEAVQLLREGGGNAWRLRMAAGRTFPEWTLLVIGDRALRAADFGTISTLVTREQLPAPGPLLGAVRLFGPPPPEAVRALVERAPAEAAGLAVSLVDDGVVLDGEGELPEGEALVPVLELAASIVHGLAADAGAGQP